MSILQKKENLENEMNWLKNMEKEKNWDINQKILTLASEILTIKDELADTQLILNQDHLTDDDLLLELVLANRQKDTKFFYSRLQREKKDKRNQLMKKLNELNSYVNLNNCFRESKTAEGELRKLNEEFLIDQSLIFKNTALLNDCKPTKEFLTCLLYTSPSPRD